jgi:DNA repair protein RadC
MLQITPRKNLINIFPISAGLAGIAVLESNDGITKSSLTHFPAASEHSAFTDLSALSTLADTLATWREKQEKNVKIKRSKTAKPVNEAKATKEAKAANLANIRSLQKPKQVSVQPSNQEAASVAEYVDYTKPFAVAFSPPRTESQRFTYPAQNHAHKQDVSSKRSEKTAIQKLWVEGGKQLSDAELLFCLTAGHDSHVKHDESTTTDVQRCEALLLELVQLQQVKQKEVSKTATLQNLGRLNGGGVMGAQHWADRFAEYGFGRAESLRLEAALELSRRRALPKPARVVASNPGSVYSEFYPLFAEMTDESMRVLALDAGLGLLAHTLHSTGGRSGTMVDTRPLFEFAMQHRAAAILLMHNHPSGQLRPSTADRELTRRVKQAGEFLQIRLADHLIFTDDGYFSFSEAGEL